MKPKLFRTSDIAFISSPILIMAIIVGVTIYDWELLSLPGIIIPSLTAAAVLAIVIIFYIKRWLFIRQYRYTTRHQLNCYFEDDSHIYSKEEIEQETDRILSAWAKYYSYNQSNILNGTYIKNVACIFKKGKASYTEFWAKKVYGTAGWDVMWIGQGQGPIRTTTFGHKLSHIFINRWREMMVPKDVAHNLFIGANINA